MSVEVDNIVNISENIEIDSRKRKLSSSDSPSEEITDCSIETNCPKEKILKLSLSNENNDGISDTNIENVLKTRKTLSLCDTSKKSQKLNSQNEKAKNKKIMSLHVFFIIVFEAANKCFRNDEGRMIFDNFQNLLTMWSNNPTSFNKLDLDDECYFYKCDLEHRNNIFRELVIRLNKKLETLKIEKGFSIEALKYFLSTFKLNLKVENFKNIKFSSESKRTSAWLNDYMRSADLFYSNVSKYQENEISLIIFLIENNLHFNSDGYNFINIEIPYRDYIYSEDLHDHYMKVYIENTKCIQVYINKYSIVTFDGISKSIASNNISSELSLLSNDYKNDDYIVFEIICNPKVYIVDVLKCSFSDLSENYLDRIKFVSSIGYESVITNLHCGGSVESSSYSNFIQVPEKGFDKPIYYYNKILTAAVVGRVGKTLLIALADSSGNLQFKGRCDICQSINIVVNTQIIQTGDDFIEYDDDECPNQKYYFINLNNKKTKLYGIVDRDFLLFKNAVSVSLKSDNKINQISNTPISHESEFREVTKNSEIKIVSNILCDINMNDFMESIKKSGRFSEFMTAFLKIQPSFPTNSLPTDIV